MESVGTRNFILRQNPYTYKYNPTSNRISEKNTGPNLCQPELGARKEFRYRSAAFSAIKEGLLFSINWINRFR